MPDGVSPAAEAISASEDALMLDSEAAAIMSSLSSGAGSNECLLITPNHARASCGFIGSTCRRNDKEVQPDPVWISPAPTVTQAEQHDGRGWL